MTPDPTEQGPTSETSASSQSLKIHDLNVRFYSALLPFDIQYFNLE